jgi:hypothetical protein
MEMSLTSTASILNILQYGEYLTLCRGKIFFDPCIVYSGTSVYIRFGISPIWYTSCLDAKHFAWYTTCGSLPQCNRLYRIGTQIHEPRHPLDSVPPSDSWRQTYKNVAPEHSCHQSLLCLQRDNSKATCTASLQSTASPAGRKLSQHGHHSQHRVTRPADRLDIMLRLSADHHHRPETPVRITTLPIPGQAMWYSAVVDNRPPSHG